MNEKENMLRPATIAVIAGMIAAVKLARVESKDIDRNSPKTRMIIGDAVMVARMIAESVQGRF
jgi:hypothetical protein